LRGALYSRLQGIAEFFWHALLCAGTPLSSDLTYTSSAPCLPACLILQEGTLAGALSRCQTQQALDAAAAAEAETVAAAAAAAEPGAAPDDAATLQTVARNLIAATVSGMQHPQYKYSGQAKHHFAGVTE